MTEIEPPPPQRRPRRPWVPRAALVFLAIVLVLLVVFVLVRPGWFEPPDESDDGESGYQKSLADIGDADGVSLSDDNTTSTTFVVPVPVDSRLDGARLALVGHTQVASESTIFLRVLADGQSVHVSQLPTGDHDLDVQVDLPEELTADGSVRVQVRTTGSLDQQRCNLSTEQGSLVYLDPVKTGIHGALDDPLGSVRDVVAGLNHDVTLGLALPEGDQDWYETAAGLAVALTQQGHDVTYVDLDQDDDLAGSSGSEILVGPDDALADHGWNASDDDSGSLQVGEADDTRYLAVLSPDRDAVSQFVGTSAGTTADTAATSPRRATPQRLSEPVTLEALGVDTSPQQIQTTRSWRAAYSLADLPGGSVPKAVRLDLELPKPSSDSRWLVQVQLNGQLVDTATLAEGGSQSLTVRLPSGLATLRNQLVVTLLRDRDLGGCNVRQSTYTVQLLPTSELVLGGSGSGFTAVPAAFAGGFDVYLPSSSTDDVAASLAGLVPTLAELSPWQPSLDVVWDGSPGTAPYLSYGPPPTGVETPVQVSDGRLSADGIDLQAMSDGLVVQYVDTGAPGVVVTPFGVPDVPLPAYGTERARVLANDGGGFVVSDSGRVETVPPVRAERAE